MLSALRIMSLALVFVLLQSASTFAVNPDEVLSDPQLEDRARSLSTEIRCLVCQNQSIDDSDAQLARDLRVLVREQLVEGKSDQEILNFLVERYGEFVLLKPRFTAKNIALWALPLMALLAGLWFIRGMFMRRVDETVSDEPTSLNDKEKAELSKILDR